MSAGTWAQASSAGASAQTSSASAASSPLVEPSSAPDPALQLHGAALLKALRDGGLVIYFRHTATDFSKNDSEMRGFEDCAHQRPLSDRGRDDARAIGRRIAALKLPLGTLKASPMCRTLEHARLMFGTVTPDAAMREVGTGSDSGLARLLSEPVPPGSNRWLVGHGNPFRAVAGPPQLAEGEAVVMRPTGSGWVVLARIEVTGWSALDPR
jgi:phosphohistidine phosphatase SixA